jgi:predicted membrane-bound spermidine synthase
VAADTGDRGERSARYSTIERDANRARRARHASWADAPLFVEYAMPSRRLALFALFTVSGFAGLIYESLWTHYLKLFLGHASYAQTLVLALFMGGMALGAWWAARRSERWSNLLRGYAIVEAIIGLAAIAFHGIFVAVTDAAYATWLPASGSEYAASLIKWSLAAALILPQSVLLGMTFPLMSAGLLRRHPEHPGEAIALLYFTNSLGAAIGVLASGFVLIERLGLPGAMQSAGAVNIALAIVVWLIAPGRDPLVASAQNNYALGSGPAPLALLLIVALLTGTASFIYEIAWIRMLSLVLGSSTHSFELMLSAFILGLALGGLWIRWRVDALPRPIAFLAGVQVAMGVLTLLTLPLYDAMFDTMQAVLRGLARTDSGYWLFLAASHGIALAIMLPATFCAGMTLPLITYSLLRGGHGERSIGRVYAANTLGSIAGVGLAAQLLLPAWGLQGTIVTGAAIDVLLGLLLLWRFGVRGRMVAAALSAALFALIGLGTGLDPYKMASGVFRRGDLYTARDAELVYYRDGKTTSVSLLRFRDDLSLRTNGKSDGAINMSETGQRISDEVTMVLTAALPLAHRPQATEVAIIGIGTGLTTHTMVAAPGVERVETIEIEPYMAQASQRFAPRNVNAFANPKSRIVFEDAKTHFSTANRQYDIIVSEPSNPWVSGVSSLFTREFYRHVKRYLKPGGVLAQWFQLYEISPALVASVLNALGEEFEDYSIYAATDSDLLIIAGDRATLAQPLADVFELPAVAIELRRVHVQNIGDIEQRRLGGKKVLAPLFAGYGVPANSDYYPYLDLHAAQQRFVQASARELTQIGLEGVPVVQILERADERRRAVSLDGDDYLHRIELSRRAAYAREFLLKEAFPEPRGIPTQLQKDLELMRLRGIDCRDPQRFDIWRQSSYQVAKLVNSSLEASDAKAIWARMDAASCADRLDAQERDWFRLYGAIAARDAGAMASLAGSLIEHAETLPPGQVQYLLTAALAGAIASGDLNAGVRLWNTHSTKAARVGIDLNLRLLYAQLTAAGRTESISPVR